jgi:hypothetical protein
MRGIFMLLQNILFLIRSLKVQKRAWLVHRAGIQKQAFNWIKVAFAIGFSVSDYCW